MSVGRKRTYWNRLKARAIGAALICPGSVRSYGAAKAKPSPEMTKGLYRWRVERVNVGERDAPRAAAMELQA